ncbi:CLUMA_CG012566, isoform A [Clunio marinus]|uniref:CLUMA_CG012566, isoform A n=1 Tax=Clunio marinus TaxID=568069 RepID=A0A1J1IGK2_9DIPT|nr:CLUMA_CG012566, isoform A [Clunio marinus]
MKIFVVNLLLFFVNLSNACTPTLTTVSGSKAPPAGFCSGDLIFEENFDNLDQSKWRHEITMAGGGNFEFQWYVNDRFNSYTLGGNLHLKPTFTSDIFGEEFLTSGRVVIPPYECTEWYNNGCDRQGTPDNIINPIRSARIDTQNSFSFKFGTLEFRAKMPAGDWLWPALWMMPKESVYGGWPRSGEIDVMEMRGNRALFADYGQGGHVGNEQASCTIHFGPSVTVKNHWPKAHFAKNQNVGWNENFHLYRVTWSPTQIRFLIDWDLVGTIEPSEGFWKYGNFESSGLSNPWSGGTNMAPFDQEFFIIINLAVGGTNFFDDSFVNRDYPKPWLNSSPRAAADFWEGRSKWEPTWNRYNDDSHLQVDYVRVWAM